MIPRVQNGVYPKRQKVREERIRTEAAPSSGCLTAGDPWGGLKRRDQRQTEKVRKAVCEQIYGEKI